MIQIKTVSDIPQNVLAHLSDYSRTELERGEPYVQDIIRRSRHIWAVYDNDVPLVCMGVIPAGLLGYQNLWFLLCEAYSIKYVRTTRRMFRRMVEDFRGLKTEIEDDFVQGCKFAKFLGFVRTDIQVTILDRTYHTYEAR